MRDAAPTEVVKTTDDALISKASCAKLGYYKDPYSIAMCRNPSARTPLINRGYWARIKFVETVVEDFLKLYKNTAVNILSLGAGLDSLYFRMADQGLLKGIAKFVEVDFPEVLQRKIGYIQRHQVFEDHRKSEGWSFKLTECSGPSYSAIPCDLSKLETLHGKLKDHSVDYTLPTLVLAECVLLYIPVANSNALIKSIAKEFTGGTAMFIYEQIRPETRFGKVMAANLRKRSLPTASLMAHPSLASQAKRFTDAGFDEANAKDLNKLYTTYIDQNDAFRVAKIQMFDEYEEWNLLMGHYCCCLAAKDPSKDSKYPKLTGKLGWLDPNRPAPKAFVPPKQEFSSSPQAGAPNAAARFSGTKSAELKE